MSNAEQRRGDTGIKYGLGIYNECKCCLMPVLDGDDGDTECDKLT